ncbi:MAG: hypothetical protein JW936_06370 [Sedimentisphaerales bacterium]|nr:hypothetical protein [Sedimentisphaerales bacterium]
MNGKADIRNDVLVAVICIAILALFLGAAGDGVRERAREAQCSAQLGLIGRAMSVYQQDYAGYSPTVCGESDREEWEYFGRGAYNLLVTPTLYVRWWRWDWIFNCEWPNDEQEARDSWAQAPIVGGSLYLLVKHGSLIPRVFVCPSAPNDRVMDIRPAIDEDGGEHIRDWPDLRDFCSMYNLSYSLHDPFKHPSTADSAPGLAIVADKNSRFDTEQGDVNINAGDGGDPTDDSLTNSMNHNQVMQNVLFADFSVRSCDTPAVGIGNDNIYTRWSNSGDMQEDKQIGEWPEAVWDNLSDGPDDSYLGN